MARSQLTYDADGHARYIDDTISTFTEKFLADHKHLGTDDKTTIFIVGLPRSGTTLVEQILATHPDVYGAGERSYLEQLIVRTNLKGYGRYPLSIRQYADEDFTNITEEYLDRLKSWSTDAVLITDKMPFNFRFLGLVRTILPQAKIIHCRRSPEATCVSISKQLFNDPQGFAYDLAELGCYYVDYKRLMEHWQSLMPNWIMDLHYEDIIADQEGETRRLLEFCNLSWDETCLDFHKTDRTVGTASNLQVRRPLYRSSVESWKRHEKHLGPLLNALKL